jgi:WD40 repeat protein/regulation of enolase protein 1 (concanavalin A-like superfamily)
LDLEDELDDYWLEQTRFGPLQRWMTALREVVLARVPGRVVVFIDEIDAVRSLPFSTDEFFAAIRECYNRRTEDPEFRRLTFCLLGVASPSDLIRDPRTTPFNIGRRVELADFTEAEAAPLAAGLQTPPPAPSPKRSGGVLSRSTVAPPSPPRGGGAGGPLPPARTGGAGGCPGQPEALLQRILYWTGGHPYLTQRLCQAAASGNRGRTTPLATFSGVDELCEELFLSPRARERDDNLLFVREQILRGEADTASILDLYGRIRRGKRVEDDEADPLVTRLRLSGITRAVDGRLEVRNRIYARVFDPQWVLESMPDAELRRQRAAFRRGVLRATAIAGTVIVVIGSLAITAIREARRADRVAREETRQRRLAQEGQEQLRHHLYAARMSVAYQAEQAGNTARARQLLEALRPEPGQTDLRGFEWRYLWRQCQDSSRATLRGHVGGVWAVAVSPDGKTVASAAEWDVRLWDVGSKRQTALFPSRVGHLFWDVVFSRNGKLLAAGNEDGTVKLWDVPSRRLLATLKAHSGDVRVLAVSPDGRLLASGSPRDRTVKLWDISARRQVGSLAGSTGWGHSLAISPDGRTLAMGQESGRVTLWDIPSRRMVTSVQGHTGPVYSLAFSSDGKQLASGSTDNTVRLWAGGEDWGRRGTAPREVAVLRGHHAPVWTVCFSSDDRLLASGGEDRTIRLWSLAAKEEVDLLKGHSQPVSSVAFLPDGRSLISGGGPEVKLWEIAARRVNPRILRPGAGVLVQELAFSPDGRALAMPGGDGTVGLWDVESGRELAILSGHRGSVISVAFSPDGGLLASGSEDQTVKLWDVASRRMRASFPGFSGRDDSVKFSPDGRLLAMWNREPPAGTGRSPSAARAPSPPVNDPVLRAAVLESVKLIDVVTNRTVASFPAAPSSWGIAISPDGKLLAALSRFGTVTLWEITTRRTAATLGGHDVIGFSPDGRALAVRDYSGSPKLWDLGAKKAVAFLGRHTFGGAVAFAPDGKTLATLGAHANDVMLWSLTTQDEAAVLKGHTGSVSAVAFAPDGNTLATASTDGTVRLWHAASLREADPLGVIAAGADRKVQLSWRPVPAAVGYVVYRAAEGSRTSPWQALTPHAIRAPSFLDESSDLVNGRPQTYAVAPIFADTKGRRVEGKRIRCRATPIAAPPGAAGYSIDEEQNTGSASFDAVARVIHLRGSGSDIWDSADHCYFLGQPQRGDFQVTVTALTKPTDTNMWAKAGLMIRESPAAGARNAFLAVTPGSSPGKGLSFQWRSTTNDETDYQQVLSDRELKTPLTLRLTRRGDAITAEYSWDGVRFHPAGEPWTFVPALPETVHVGLAISSHDIQKTTEARFRDLRIRAVR